MQQPPSEMANSPLRNVDKLINKALCHRRADSFINKVHTTVIMQTVAVSSAKLTPLHAAAAMVCIHHCSANGRTCQSNSPLHFRLSQMVSKFTVLSSGFFSTSLRLSWKNTAARFTPDYSQLELDARNFGKNHLRFTNSPADRGKELLKPKHCRNSPPTAAFSPDWWAEPIPACKHSPLTRSCCCSLWWLRVPGLSLKFWFRSSKRRKLSKHCTAETWTGRTSLICGREGYYFH